MDWFTDTGIDVTAAFQGFTAPTDKLMADIQRRGWTVNKVKINKDGQYEAEVSNPYGEKLTKTGPTDNTAIGNALIAIMRRETIRYKERSASWSKDWHDQLGEVAQAYAKAPMYDAKAAIAWKELADDMKARADRIRQEIHVEYTNDPTPYLSFEEMCDDIKKKQHVYITKHNATHPLWSAQEVLDYRLVRDVLGHCVAGGDFGWMGENRATAAMMPMLSPNAQRALFTESIGQAAFNNHYQQFGPQKIVFLDDHLQALQDEENSPGQAATHPSQVVLPGQLPDLTREGAVRSGDPCEQCGSRNTRVYPGLTEQDPFDIWCFDCNWHKVVVDDDVQGSLFTASADSDPNDGWESGIAPLPDNAYLWRKETNGLDPMDHRGLRDLAEKLDTKWHTIKHPDGQPDFETQRQAVSNAIKAVLLAPRKNLRWQATHYQHLIPVPTTTQDPTRYWEALETHRDHHNMARGLPPGIHRIWDAEEAPFHSWVKATYPHLPDHEIRQIAKSELFHMLAEEEQRLGQEDVDHKLSAQDLEELAGKALQKRLKTLVKPTVNQKTDVTANIMNQPDPGVYGSYLVSPLKVMAAAHKHIDDLTEAARHDVEKGGKGHHWRHAVLARNIPGFGAKEASHAWMLLQPKTSELAIINPQISEILGHKPEEITKRDYFKHERELAAGRDAAGYGHLPLGLFGIGLWDYRRGGPGYHSDYETQRVLWPKPHDQADWANHEARPEGKWFKPYWWESTKAARDQVADEWDSQIAPTTPSHEVPFQKTAAVSPWFINQNGERHEGRPDQSLMALMRESLGLSTEDVWRNISEAGKDAAPATQ